MKNEKFKAENADEIVWLRLNRLKSTKLCENLIRKKLATAPNPVFTDETIKNKAIGLSAAIESAIGYWQGQPLSLNARILSRYYFLLQLTIAEQVSKVGSTDDLKEIQRHTEFGHGLATITNPEQSFPDNYYIYPLMSGHFSSYAKSIGLDIRSKALERREKVFNKIQDHSKLVSLTDLFRRIPELNKVVEEYLEKPPLAFHVGYSMAHNSAHREIIRGESFGEPRIVRENAATNVSIYPTSAQTTIDYLKSLSLPFTSLRNAEDSASKQSYIVGTLVHPADKHWHQQLQVYTSSYATSTYALPLWTNTYDSVVANFALLYALSIIVRYLPDLWYRITSGDLNHIGSLIEYYISIMDHVLPLQMLERITGTSITIHSPGSFFGEI